MNSHILRVLLVSPVFSSLTMAQCLEGVWQGNVTMPNAPESRAAIRESWLIARTSRWFEIMRGGTCDLRFSAGAGDRSRFEVAAIRRVDPDAGRWGAIDGHVVTNQRGRAVGPAATQASETPLSPGAVVLKVLVRNNANIRVQAFEVLLRAFCSSPLNGGFVTITSSVTNFPKLYGAIHFPDRVHLASRQYAAFRRRKTRPLRDPIPARAKAAWVRCTKPTILVYDGMWRSRFRRRASMNHPNLCTLYDIGPDYLVMELV
jgi:hypothetical protein